MVLYEDGSAQRQTEPDILSRVATGVYVAAMVGTKAIVGCVRQIDGEDVELR